MAQKKIIKQLKKFKKEVNATHPITRMIFFGSRAWGKPHRDSDIDLLIVSPAFRKKESFERGVEFYDYWDLNYPVDFLCYTPEEFNKLSKMVTLVREAARKGIVI